MLLLHQANEKVSVLKQEEFGLEKELQNFVEKNLDELLHLELVKTEFVIENYRLDTLAYDKENKSFVIIEYKRGNSCSVIDQGYSYLSTILNNKADIILEYNEIIGKTLKRDEIDWSQTKIIFISQSFNKFQKDSLNFKNLPIELYEIKKYENNLITFERIRGRENSEDINLIAKDSIDINKVSKEIKNYSIDYHLENSNEKIKNLFNEFKEKIEEEIPEVEIIPKKVYIAFKLNGRNIIDFKLQKSFLKFWINAKKGQLNDFKKLAKDVSNKEHNGNGDYEFNISDSNNINYIVNLLSEFLKKN